MFIPIFRKSQGNIRKMNDSKLLFFPFENRIQSGATKDAFILKEYYTIN